MFVESFKEIPLINQKKIVELSRSKCGRFLAVLTETALLIKDLRTSDYETISIFERNTNSLNTCGLNRWVQWMSSLTISICTQTGTIFFFTLNNQGEILSHSIISINQMITAHSTIFNALVIAISGPCLLFLSAAGEIRAKINFTKPPETLIRQIDMNEKYGLFVFSDGHIASAELRQEEIVKQSPIYLNVLSFTSIESVSMGKDQVCLIGYDGTVFLSNLGESSDAFLICSNGSIVRWTRDNSFIVILTTDGSCTIYSTSLCASTTANLGIESPPQTAAMDADGLRLLLVSNGTTYSLRFARCDPVVPSAAFHTDSSVVNAITGEKLEAPSALIADGFPVLHAAFMEDGGTAIAGRRHFAAFDGKNWVVKENKTKFCRSLWSQKNNHLLSIIFDSETPKYNLVLISFPTMTAKAAIPLPGPVTAIAFNDDMVMISTTKDLSLFKVTEDQIEIVSQKPLESSIDLMILTGTEAQIVSNGCLQSKDPMFGVTQMIRADAGVKLIVASRQPFAESFGELARLSASPLLVEGMYYYALPKRHKIGDYILDKNSYMVNLILKNSTDSRHLFRLINAVKSEGIIEAVVEAIRRSFIDGSFDFIANSLSAAVPAVKDHFFVVALIELPEHAQEIMRFLPSKESLLEKFPSLAVYIEDAFKSS